MRDLKYILKQSYDSSRALIIGINKYQNANPLSYAVNDAFEVKETLINDLNFESNNIIYLTDEEATKANILKSFLSFTSEDVKVDDRIFVFFAGHGHTKSGFRGDVGYLVPHDANMADYSTFIRWDELTRNTEIIRAKHILFVMDACYGGLAVNRDMRPGATRFLRDMYQRFSRQVITAGKANQVVSDSGGPLPNHSIFTGHLIEGIKGKAATEYGVITANSLMAYVYAKVSSDINSEQTPHYGQFDGDGDFILLAPNIDNLNEEKQKNIDELISIPYSEEQNNHITLDDKVTYIKELLSSQKAEIRIHDFITSELRRFISLSEEVGFDTNEQYSDDKFLERISSYEECSKDIGVITSTISYWATEHETKILTKVISRISDRLIENKNGITTWLSLRWYPLVFILYQAGISAIENKNYKSLAAMLYTTIDDSNNRGSKTYFTVKLANEITKLAEYKLFNKIPNHERFYTPLSEYLHKQLQPMLDDQFFLGQGYESVFDEFEVMYSLTVADLKKQTEGITWGPIGRFGWKNRTQMNSPFNKILSEAAALKNEWPPLKAGMFGGSYERFEQVANKIKENLTHLHWY